MPRHAQRDDIRLTDGDFYASEPFEQYRWMRTNAPVYFDGEVWGVARHDDVQTVSKDSQTFCNRHGMRPDSPPVPSMINMDDPDHKLRRGLVNKGFTPRRVADHEPHVRQICRQLIARVAPQGRCDFVAEIAAPLPMIMIGDMLAVLTRKKLALDTCSLYAPACTVAFARSTYLKAIDAGTLDPAKIFIDILSNENERADSVGPYLKSLLYLVSRAFEAHKTPILGMEAVWNASHDKDGVFNDAKGNLDPTVVNWRKDWKSAGGANPFVLSKKEVATGPQTSQHARHGCFDNWVDGVSATINRMRHEKVGKPLDKPIGSLEY